MHLILVTNDDFDQICFFSSRKAGCQFNSTTTELSTPEYLLDNASRTKDVH